MPHWNTAGSPAPTVLPASPRQELRAIQQPGYQRRTEKLFQGIYAGNGEAAKNAYTDVWWTEDKSADLTDPDALTDMQRIADRLLTRFKGQASFTGGGCACAARPQLPMSFGRHGRAL